MKSIESICSVSNHSSSLETLKIKNDKANQIEDNSVILKPPQRQLAISQLYSPDSVSKKLRESTNTLNIKATREFIQKIDTSSKEGLSDKDWEEYSNKAHEISAYYYKNKDKYMNLSLAGYYFSKALQLPHNDPISKSYYFIKEIESSQEKIYLMKNGKNILTRLIR
jgi:hypothetical protein